MIDNISGERGRNPRIKLLGAEDGVVGDVARASVGWLMRLEFKVGSGGRDGEREGGGVGVGWFYFAFLVSLFASASAFASVSFGLRKIDDEGFSRKEGMF